MINRPTPSSGHTSVIPRLGSTLNCLLGDVSYSSDFELAVHAVQLVPPDSFDFLLRTTEYAMEVPAVPFMTPWVSRALSQHTISPCVSTSTLSQTVSNDPHLSQSSSSYVSNAATKKYKPVDRKVRPVPTYMPNPSAQRFKPISIPTPLPLPFSPPSISNFVPTNRLTRERLDLILSKVPDGFLTPTEIDLLVYILDTRQGALAFCDNERGTFNRQYYPDYIIPHMEHTPWVQEPIRIPKAVESEVRLLLANQRKAGKYEYSCASYRSRVFPVAKTGGKLRLVHDLQEMNKIVIRDAALPPRPDDFAESFVGRAVYGVADLFSGFDARTLAEVSRDLTTFHCLDGPERLTVLPQGCTNSVQEFQRCARHAIQPEIPNHADVFIDDCGIKGPRSRYNDEVLPENPGIRKFIYEYAMTLDRVFARFEESGLTASGTKLIIASPKVQIVGSVVSLEGWHLAHGIVTKVLNWPCPQSVTEVRGFLGVAGVGRHWIKGFSLIAKPLTSLCRKSEDLFEFGLDAREAFATLKQLITTAPVLREVDYEAAGLIRPPPRVCDDGLLVLSVDSSVHGSGWVLYQIYGTEKHPALFGSCTFNRAESNYSQPKVELYGVFRAVKEVRHRIWGVHFRLEVDAKFLEQMIKEPDLPNAPMTRWVTYIQLFDFSLRHVPATSGVAQDGLSRKRRTSVDSDDSDGEAFLDTFFASSAIALPPYKGERNTPPLLHSFLWDQMSSGEHTGFDVLPFFGGTAPPEYALVSMGVFASERGANIAEWEEDHASDEPSVAAWDANLVEGIPNWYRREHNQIPGEPRFPYARESSPFHPALLRNRDDVSYVGPEFMKRKVGQRCTDYFLFGGELVELEFHDYRPAFLTRAEHPTVVTNFIGSLTAVSQAHARRHAHQGRGDTSLTIRSDHRRRLLDIPKPKPFKSGKVNVDLQVTSHAAKTFETDNKRYWRFIQQFLETGELPLGLRGKSRESKRFIHNCSQYLLRDGRLWKISKGKVPQLVVLDLGRRRELVAEHHNNASHRGRDPTYLALADRYFWPNMYDEVEWFVRSCDACQYRAKARSVTPYNITHSPTIFRRLVCDTIHMPGSTKYLLHASCAVSKWPEAKAVKKNTSEAWASFLHGIICRIGCVMVLTCDGGSEFKGAVRILLEKYNIAVIMSSPYNPQGNGIAERDGQTLMNAILKTCGDKPHQWPKYLNAALLAVRTTTSRATGYTPYFLIYGVHCLFPFDVADRSWFVLDWHEVKSTEDLLSLRMKQLARREEDIGTAVQHLDESRRRSADDANRRNAHRLAEPLDPNTWVLIHETWLDNQHGNKGALRWAGPYVVHQQHPSGSYSIRELDGSLLKEKVAASRLKRFYFRDHYHWISVGIFG